MQKMVLYAADINSNFINKIAELCRIKVNDLYLVHVSIRSVSPLEIKKFMFCDDRKKYLIISTTTNKDNL